MLLTHYYEWARFDKAYITWDNNPKEDNMVNGALHLEDLEADFFSSQKKFALP